MKIDQSWYVKPPGIAEHTSCGGVVVRKDQSGIWVALVRERNQVQYVLPKGHLDPGEDEEKAARREIAEESGLTHLNILGDLGLRGRLDFGRKNWKNTRYFLFSTNQVEGTPTDPNHPHKVGWFPLDQLPEMFWPEQKALIDDKRDMIRKIFE